MTNLVGGAHGAIFDADAKSERLTIRFTDRTNPRLANYRPLTTGVDLERRIDGVSAIERFARDQKNRDYLVVKSFDNTAEVWIHESHLLATDPE